MNPYSQAGWDLPLVLQVYIRNGVIKVSYTAAGLQSYWSQISVLSSSGWLYVYECGSLNGGWSGYFKSLSVCRHASQRCSLSRRADNTWRGQRVVCVHVFVHVHMCVCTRGVVLSAVII